jgi:hypothetical protein
LLNSCRHAIIFYKQVVEESNLKNKRFLYFFLMILIGAGIGLAVGWLAFPPQAIEQAKLSQLREDFKTDVALMTAEQYAVNKDAMTALDNLAKIAPSDPVNYLVSTIKFAEAAGYPAADLGKMRTLFNGIDAKILQDWKAGATNGN